MFRIVCSFAKSTIITKNISKTVAINTIRCRSTLNLTTKDKTHSQDAFVKWMLFVIPVSTLGLGCWQVYRLNWKRDLIHKIKERTLGQAVELPEDFSELASMEYMPVKVRGKFLHDKEYMIGPRALIDDESNSRAGSIITNPKKNQGWLVITPFQLSDSDEIILINRGWILQSMKSKLKREPSLIDHEVELQGIVRLAEKRAPFIPSNQPDKGLWFYRDLEQMSEYVGCSPVWLDVCGIKNPPEGWPIPNQTRLSIRNEHLSYIITWYSLSILTGLMWYRYFIRKLPLL